MRVHEATSERRHSVLAAAAGAAAIWAAIPSPAAADVSPCPAATPGVGASPCAAIPSPSPSPIPPSVVISPFQGQPGTAIAITGTHFTPGEGLAVYWDTPAVRVAQAAVGGDGSFHAQFRAPDGSAANHSVCADEAGAPHCDVFQLLSRPPPPAMRLAPISGAPGSRITVSASGLPPGLTVTVAMRGSAALAHATVAADGTASVTFLVPSAPVGPAQVCLDGTAATLCSSLAVVEAASAGPVPAATPAAPSSFPGAMGLLVLLLAALAVAGGTWWVIRRRAEAPLPATVRHRVGEASLPSTHPQYWDVLSDPAGSSSPTGAPGAPAERPARPGRRGSRAPQDPSAPPPGPPRRLGRRRR